MDLDQWLATLANGTGTADVRLDNDAIAALLDLTRDAAHEVERVAGPLTTFLVGVAVGRGEPLETAVARASTLLLAPGGAEDDPGRS